MKSPLRHILPAIIVLALADSSFATTYFVDFEGGADGNAGTSPATAFKHCPGDPGAAGTPASAKLQAGDTVHFKGGVAYRGMVNVTASGTGEQPITFDGNTAGTFGTGNAIIEGSEPLTGWKRCASGAEAKGNPRFAEIFYVDVPSPKAWNSLNLCDASTALPLSQQPNPKDPLFQENIEDYALVDEPLHLVSPNQITPEKGLRLNKQRPLILMITKQSGGSASSIHLPAEPSPSKCRSP